MEFEEHSVMRDRDISGVGTGEACGQELSPPNLNMYRCPAGC